MHTHDETASEPGAAAMPRRGGPDWGHLPHGNLTNLIIGAGFEVHNVLGAGFLEAVYANALTVELRHRGLAVDRNVAFEIVYRGFRVGRYVADLVVDQKVIVETKVAKAIDPMHRAQVSNYLRASDSKWASSSTSEALSSSSVSWRRRTGFGMQLTMS